MHHEEHEDKHKLIASGRMGTTARMQKVEQRRERLPRA
jgi:hypothetical protein